MFCKNCGKEIDDDSKFCDSCGQVVSKKENKTNVEESLNAKEKESIDNKEEKNKDDKFIDSIVLYEKNSILKAISIIISMLVTSYIFFLGYNNTNFFILTIPVGIISLLFCWWMKFTFIKYIGECSNCGNIIKLNNKKLICKECNSEYKYTIIKNKTIENIMKFGIVFIIALSIACIFLYNILHDDYDYRDINSSQKISQNSSTNVKPDDGSYVELYKLNNIGILKKSKISENYNDMGDLIKMSIGNLGNYDVEYSYEYDDSGRVIKIMSNRVTGHIEIDYYDGLKIKEVRVIHKNLSEENIYYFSYEYADNSEYPTITKSYYDYWKQVEEIRSKITFEEFEFESKKYIKYVELDNDGNKVSTGIYEKLDLSSKNIFNILGMLPNYDYKCSFNTDRYEQSYFHYIDNTISQVNFYFNPIYSVYFGKPIVMADYNGTTKYYYNKNGQLLCRESEDSVSYYMYRDESDYYYTYILEKTLNNNYFWEYSYEQQRIFYSSNEIEKVELVSNKKVNESYYDEWLPVYQNNLETQKVNVPSLD